MHLVGFIIRIYHDERSPERQELHPWYMPVQFPTAPTCFGAILVTLRQLHAKFENLLIYGGITKAIHILSHGLHFLQECYNVSYFCNLLYFGKF